MANVKIKLIEALEYFGQSFQAYIIPSIRNFCYFFYVESKSEMKKSRWWINFLISPPQFCIHILEFGKFVTTLYYVPEVLNVHVNENKKNLLFLEGFFFKQ